MSPSDACLGSLGERFHGNAQPDRLQPGDEAPSDAGGLALVEVIMAQVRHIEVLILQSSVAGLLYATR